MSEHEHEKLSEPSSEDREETMKDLDVPEDDSKDVKGGAYDYAANKKV